MTERIIQPVKNLAVEIEDLYVEMPSGLLIPSDLAPEPAKRVPTSMDLFAGCGGFGLGFHQAGFHVIAASEWDAHATWTYLVNLGSPKTVMHFPQDSDRVRWEAHCKKYKITPDSFGTGWIASKGHPIEDCKWEAEVRESCHATYCSSGFRSKPCEHFFFGDIRQLKCEAVLEVMEMERGDLDCITGGPPCQGYSNAGKRNVLDPRNSLVFEFCRVIVGLQPKTFVFENVPGIVNMVTPEGVNVVDAICLYLADGGYGTYDALKKSLAGMPNARGAVKRTGNTQSAKQRPPAPKQKSKEPQAELFA